MNALTFDTLKFANRLKAVGINPAHAQAEAQALSEVLGAVSPDIATKFDLRELELHLPGELSLMKWMLGLTIAAIVSLLLKAFF